MSYIQKLKKEIMENKKLNIAEILKDKPKDTKLWSDTFGEVTLKDVTIDKRNGYPIFLATKVYDETLYLDAFGRYYKNTDCLRPCIVPSKDMRDWKKFAWKKGDVLSNGTSNFCIFDSWHSSNYTLFKAFYATPYYSDKVYGIKKWTKETDKKIIKQYIFNIELYYGGKLNLETLEIEKYSEPVLKDGDFITITCNSGEDNYIAIYRYANTDTKIMSTYAYFLIDNIEGDKVYRNGNFRLDDCLVLPATEEEKQQILNVLANENETWDAEDKQIVFHPILPYEEKQPEFKNGDILTYDGFIFIFKNKDESVVYPHATCDIGNKDNVVCNEYKPFASNRHIKDFKYAIEEERQRLFDALAKKGKKWDAEKKQIVDLQFKPFDKVLVRNLDEDEWKPDFFLRYEPTSENFYAMISGAPWTQCIPYNDSTKHLLGTTDDWKGGE